MEHSPLEVGKGTDIVARSLKAIRKKRELTAAQVAEVMGMPIRTYQQFESGHGPLTHERIFAFAEATDSDPFAIIFATLFQLPDLALDCANTKFCMIMMLYFEEFVEERESDILFLEPMVIAVGFRELFKDISAKLDERGQILEKYFGGPTGSISLSVLRQRLINRRKPKKGDDQEER